MTTPATHMIRRLLDDENLPPEDADVQGDFDRYVSALRPEFEKYNALMALVNRYDLYVSGRVTRNSRYVHERTTDFELELADVPADHEEPIYALLDDVQAIIQKQLYAINHKIYKALEREYDYQNADEQVDGSIVANDYAFDENGDRDDAGGFNFGQLDLGAKVRARAWYREGTDLFWSEDTIEEWTSELAAMGFSDVDIAWSGFSSQGDGASFTANGFDLRKWIAWWSSDQPTERGHPYTDDLPPEPVRESVEDDVDSPEAFGLADFILNPVERKARMLGFKQQSANQPLFSLELLNGAYLTLRRVWYGAKYGKSEDDWELHIERANGSRQMLGAATTENMEAILPTLLKIHSN